jgi:hypothetical protein
MPGINSPRLHAHPRIRPPHEWSTASRKTRATSTAKRRSWRSEGHRLSCSWHHAGLHVTGSHIHIQVSLLIQFSCYRRACCSSRAYLHFLTTSITLTTVEHSLRMSTPMHPLQGSQSCTRRCVALPKGTKASLEGHGDVRSYNDGIPMKRGCNTCPVGQKPTGVHRIKSVDGRIGG